MMNEDFEGRFGMQGGGGQGGGAKQKIAQALLDALATNGTRNAYLVVGNILKGDVDLGVDKMKTMELAMSTLIKNVGDPNNPGRSLLWLALTQGGQTPPPAKDEKGSGKPIVSLQQRAKELHLGFAIASMNGLIGASGPPPKQNANSFGSMGGSMMEGSDGGEMRMDSEPGGSRPDGGRSAPAAAPTDGPADPVLGLRS